jgi:hypothetical protein
MPRRSWGKQAPIGGMLGDTDRAWSRAFLVEISVTYLVHAWSDELQRVWRCCLESPEVIAGGGGLTKRSQLH